MIDDVKKMFQGNMRQYGMIIALFFLIILFGVLTDGILFQPMNATNIIQQNAYVLILAIGMLFCIVTGNVDLSVGSVVAFVGAVSAIFIIQWEWPVWLGILASLSIGALVGAFQGYFIAYIKIPAFIVTLAGMLIFRGLTMVILGGKTIAPYPESFQFFATGFVMQDVKVGELAVSALLFGILLSCLYIAYEIIEQRNKRKYNYETSSNITVVVKMVMILLCINVLCITLARYNGLPFVLVIILFLSIVYTFIANKTVLGRHIYALGGNEKAAKLSGVKTKEVTFWVYVNMGILAALAGIIVAGRLNAATPKAGMAFELDAIAACYIGGASATGGIGTIYGAIIGGLVMGILNNGMSILGVGIDWQQVIKGLVLLVAVTFDIYSKSKAKTA